VPVVPTTKATRTVRDEEEDDEVDIYVPGIASVRLEDVHENDRGRTQSTGEDSKALATNNNDDEEEKASGDGESYEDLAARFAKLQR
jgi:hypothetical protein